MSVKRIRHSKRTAVRREIGDQMMMIAEEAGTVPTVETLMSSPISNVIQFAANDYGYGRTNVTPSLIGSVLCF